MQIGDFQLDISHIMLSVHWPCPFILLPSWPASVFQIPPMPLHKSHPFPILNPFSSVSGEAKALYNHNDLWRMDTGDHKNTVVKQFIAGAEYNLDQYPVGFALEYKHLSPNETGGKSQRNRSKINSDTLMLKVKYLF